MFIFLYFFTASGNEKSMLRLFGLPPVAAAKKILFAFAAEVTEVPLLIRFWLRRRVESLEPPARWAFLLLPASCFVSHFLLPAGLVNGFTLCHRLEYWRACRKRGHTRRMSYARLLCTFHSLCYAHSIPFGCRFAFDVLQHSSAVCWFLLQPLLLSCFPCRAKHFSNPSPPLASVGASHLTCFANVARWFRNEV